MKKPVRAYEFLKTFDPDTIIMVKNPPGDEPDILNQWSAESLYRREILSASLGIYQGKVVVAVYVSSDDTTPAMAPFS